MKAEINKKDGTHIIIEGDEGEVRRIIESFSSIKKEEKKSSWKNKEKPGKLSISDLILELKEEGFFDNPKGLVEIKNALEVKGMIYPMTTLSGAAIKQVKKRELGRIKDDNKWKYVKR